MSTLAQPNGDDYPEAARKNYCDAQALYDVRRPDSAGYHAGYVVECSLKTLVQLDDSYSTARALGHDLAGISGAVALLAANLVAGSAARYSPTLDGSSGLYAAPGAAAVAGAATSSMTSANWSETLRYRPEGVVSDSQASAWLAEAISVYNQTVVKMRLDGVI